MSDYLKGKRVVDPVLTSIARGYKNAAFIGEHIFPIVQTDKEGVTVPTFGKSAFVEYDTERAVGADSNVLVREKTGKLDLVLNEHDLAAPVDYREQAESMFNEEAKAIRRVTSGVNLKRELYAARPPRIKTSTRHRQLKHWLPLNAGWMARVIQSPSSKPVSRLYVTKQACART